jgi:ribosomal protein S18 acetylase RimI-like enzyme
MPPVRVEPLADDHRDQCAALLAERHARHRRREPLLPACDDFAAQLPDAPGYAALQDGRVVAYVAGAIDEDAAGPIGRVGLAGCAAAEPEAVRDAYAALAADWAAAGCTRHEAIVPAGDEGLVDVFWRLAFGRQLTWAVREAEPPLVRNHHERDLAPAVRLRPSTPADLGAIVALDRELQQAVTDSPSFARLRARTDDELREEWSDLWDEGAPYEHVVAELDGRVAGHLLLYDRPAGDLRVPPRSLDLAQAVIAPGARGRGVGLALTAHALERAVQRGLDAVTVDWREPNLWASRFWPQRGFRPQFLRLYRSVP